MLQRCVYPRRLLRQRQLFRGEGLPGGYVCGLHPSQRLRGGERVLPRRVSVGQLLHFG